MIALPILFCSAVAMSMFFLMLSSSWSLSTRFRSWSSVSLSLMMYSFRLASRLSVFSFRILSWIFLRSASLSLSDLFIVTPHDFSLVKLSSSFPNRPMPFGALVVFNEASLFGSSFFLEVFSGFCVAFLFLSLFMARLIPVLLGRYLLTPHRIPLTP